LLFLLRKIEGTASVKTAKTGGEPSELEGRGREGPEKRHEAATVNGGGRAGAGQNGPNCNCGTLRAAAPLEVKGRSEPDGWSGPNAG